MMQLNFKNKHGENYKSNHNFRFMIFRSLASMEYALIMKRAYKEFKLEVDIKLWYSHTKS